MPQIDMPLEQLRNYKGINPKPDDFDMYWANSLKELQSVDPMISFEEDSLHYPGVKLYHMFYRSIGNAKIHAKVLIPEGKRNCPAICAYHGYRGHMESWCHFLPYACAGFVVASIDCRGQGGLSEDTGSVKGPTMFEHAVQGLEDPNPYNLHYRQVFLDAVRLAQIVMGFPEVDQNKIYTLGGSQGGALALATAALEPRIKKAAVCYPFLSDFKRVWEMDLCERAYVGIKYFFRFRDPKHLHEEEIFTRLGYIDIHNLAPYVKADVLFGTGLMDTVCPPSTQFAVYNNLHCQKRMEIFPDFGHEDLPDFDDEGLAFFLNGV